MSELEDKIRREIRQQYREEGTTECPPKYAADVLAATIWHNESKVIHMEETRSI